MSERRFGNTVPPHERPPVAWYQVDVLWTAARDVISSLDQLRNRDLRESYPSPLTVIDRSGLDCNGEFWFDFIADTGDGGNATYAVANATLQPVLTVELPDGGMEKLPRGELLLLGGDLAYPGASSDEYRYRFVELFEAARNGASLTAKPERPYTLAALAQNHDWMDSASTFSRYFMRKSNRAPLLGAEIPQQQSYFCVKLPKNWWVLGFDFALVGDLDENQYEEFRQLLTDAEVSSGSCDGGNQFRIAEADNVLLIYPEPYWTRPLGDRAEPGNPRRYQMLEGLLGDRVRMRLAGDLHHYLRWESERHGQLVTCGTGGAFTHPTHTRATTYPVCLETRSAGDRIPPDPPLKKSVQVGRVAKRMGHERQEGGREVFNRVDAADYPDKCTSRLHALRNPIALLQFRGFWAGNWTFALFLGVLYWLSAYFTGTSFHESFRPDGFSAMHTWSLTQDQFVCGLLLWGKATIFSPIGFIVNALIVAGCVAMGREVADDIFPLKSKWIRWPLTILFGILHGLVHVFAVYSLQFVFQIVVAVGVLQSPAVSPDGRGLFLHSILVGVGMWLGGALVGAIIFGFYLSIMSLLGCLTNNGYSALGIEDYKGFLRFKITANGDLVARFVALKVVPRRWKRNGSEGAPYWISDDLRSSSPTVHDNFEIRSERGH